MYRRTFMQYLTICVAGLLLVSTSVHAGSFRNFILGDELSSSAPRSVDIPADSEIASCLQCHDGNAAQDIRIKHADTTMTFSSHGSSDHPVGMSYERYARKIPAAYVAPAELDPRIKLDNGNVTCISCHETKQARAENTNLALVDNPDVATINVCTSTKNLTTGPNSTRLCLACHAK